MTETKSAPRDWSATLFGGYNRLVSAAASSPISVQTFAAWACEQSASGALTGSARLSPVGGGLERIAGAAGTMAPNRKSK